MNFNTQFLIDELANSEAGYAKIFIKYYTGIIYITNMEKGSGFIWNNSIKLYEPLCEAKLRTDLQDLLQDAMTYLLKQVDLIPMLDDSEKMKKKKFYSGKVSECGKIRTVKNVFAFIYPHYYNREIVMDISDHNIPVADGKLINLKNGKIYDRTPENLYTSAYKSKYLGSGDEHSPKTIKFLMELATMNTAKYKFLRAILGSSITNAMEAKCFFILYGKKGNNGKSTLLKLMAEIFAKNTVQINENVLFSNNQENDDATKLACFKGKTLGLCCEPRKVYLESAVLKKLTGDDGVAGRHLYSEQFNFTPVAKIFIALNNVIKFKTVDEEIMKQRTRVINFNSRFITEAPTKSYEFKGDEHLKENFLGPYRDDFFTCIINSAIQFFQTDTRLPQPKELENELNDYFEGMDETTNIIKSYYVITGNKKDLVKRSDIYSNYEKACEERGWDIKKKHFLQYLTTKFGETVRADARGNECHKGLRIKTEDDILREEEAKEKLRELEELRDMIKIEPEPEPTISEQKTEPTISEQKTEPTISEQKTEPIGQVEIMEFNEKQLNSDYKQVMKYFKPTTKKKVIHTEIKPVVKADDIKPEEIKPVVIAEEIKPVVVKPKKIKPVVKPEEIKPIVIAEEIKPIVIAEEIKPVAIAKEAKTVIKKAVSKKPKKLKEVEIIETDPKTGAYKTDAKGHLIYRVEYI